jgi:hypothetical protein
MPDENDSIELDLSEDYNAIVSRTPERSLDQIIQQAAPPSLPPFGFSGAMGPPTRPLTARTTAVIPPGTIETSGEETAQDFGGRELPTTTAADVVNRYPANTPIKEFKLRYDPTKIKVPDPNASTAYTIIDKSGVVHKSDDQCTLTIDFVPPDAVETFADLRERDHWTSLTESPIMTALEAVRVKEDLETLKVWVRLNNPNAKQQTDKDIIRARRNDLKKAQERNSSPAEIEKAERAAKFAKAGFKWQDKVLASVPLDEKFIKEASGEVDRPVPEPPPLVQEHDEGSGRFEDLISELDKQE